MRYFNIKQHCEPEEMYMNEKLNPSKFGKGIKEITGKTPLFEEADVRDTEKISEILQKHKDIESLLNYADSFQSNISKDKNGVRLMTVHKAKGLEYPVVFLIGLVNGILPNMQGDIEEERRIAFVAMSRAMQKLYLSYSQKFMGKTVERSQFVKEMFQE